MNDYEDDDLVEDGPPTAEKNPVLAELWDNEDDAVYDDPEWQEAEREAEKTSGPAASRNSPRPRS